MLVDIAHSLRKLTGRKPGPQGLAQRAIAPPCEVSLSRPATQPCFDDRKITFAIQPHMVKIAQTLSARRWMMDLAVDRRNEEETDLRVRHLR
jgi:hypothetical protein